MSCGGNVFEALLSHRLFKKYWYEEIDRLYINYNNHVGAPVEVVSEFLATVSKDPKVHLIYHPRGIGNGVPITEMLQVAKEENLLLLEDDFFIFTSGKVDEFFKRIESQEVDVLGSPRYAYGEVADAAKNKYNLDYSGLGDKGFGWWPTGFFCKREDLMKTDLDFASNKYAKGQYFKELDHTFVEDCYTDTFTWASIQLRYLGVRSEDIPQFHFSPTEVEDKKNKIMNWVDGNTPFWWHAGSLSSGWGGYLLDSMPDTSNENAVLEIESRCAWWKFCADVSDGFSSFRIKYQEGVENLVNRGNFDRGRIENKYNLIKETIEL